MPHPPEIVWEVLSDPATVVSCIDGSELGEQHEDGTFDARLAVKFAAIKVGFAARISLDLDEAERTGRMEARGADSRGSTRVQGNAAFAVSPTATGSEVALDGVIELNGQLASLVTTGAAVVVDRMTRTFSEKLEATCAERDPATAGRGAALVPHTPAAQRLTAWLGRVWRRVRDLRASRQARTHARKSGA
ncbi:hypothetical protein LH076_01130 [Nocardioides sp. Kera G14]|nr:SRPBCC domain-containing protein [Nocardioides sp. Kera G14]UDY23932.1 hypothetical protein LH076_01130 [Nocardioides sp. Kera G14]